MLTCIALAGVMYFHIEHDESRGVRTSGSTWETIIPVQGTRVRRASDHDGNSNDNIDEYTVWFHPIDGRSVVVYLEQDRFPNWTPVDLLSECNEINR